MASKKKSRPPEATGSQTGRRNTLQDHLPRLISALALLVAVVLGAALGRPLLARPAANGSPLAPEGHRSLGASTSTADLRNLSQARTAIPSADTAAGHFENIHASNRHYYR